jgi:hypothetical protein
MTFSVSPKVFKLLKFIEWLLPDIVSVKELPQEEKE